MSLILDALRKMEQERKARQGAAQDLRPEVLRYRSRMKPQKGRPFLLLAGVLLLAAAIGAGAFYKGKRDAARSEAVLPGHPATTPPAAAPALPEPVAPAAQVAPVAPAAESEYSRTSEGAAVVTSPAVVAPAPQPSTSAHATTQPAPSAEPLKGESSSRTSASTAPGAKAEARPAPGRATAANSARADSAATEGRVKPRQAAEVMQAPPSDIAISGIAFQDERHLRRAVINGTLVGEGAEVAGARVVEIKEHKVRMSRGGKLFDVPFASGMR